MLASVYNIVSLNQCFFMILVFLPYNIVSTLGIVVINDLIRQRISISARICNMTDWTSNVTIIIELYMLIYSLQNSLVRIPWMDSISCVFLSMMFVVFFVLVGVIHIFVSKSIPLCKSVSRFVDNPSKMCFSIFDWIMYKYHC
jgi:hypothetical protein